MGRTAADVRDVMIEGESGILAVSPPWCRPVYQPSKRRLTWPNGAIATTYSGDKPDQLRGPQHDGAWCDEVAAWRYPDAWDQLNFGLRLGDDPRAVVTTTPRPVKHVRELIADHSTHTTRGSTYDNRGNLAPQFFQQIIRKYEGTRLGRQELNAELLEDNPYALWKRSRIDELRVTKAPELRQIAVAIDPAVSCTEDSAETGIVVGGVAADGQGYILDDCSLQESPAGWARQAVSAFHRHKANYLVAEVNQGGDMVRHTLQTVEATVPIRTVHASRGKLTRAEPVAALYEQGRVHHVGCFPQLEDQMCEWIPGEASPDRMDALVWVLTLLMVGGPQELQTTSSLWD